MAKASEGSDLFDIWIFHRFETYSRACVLIAMFIVPVAVHIGTVSAFQLVKLTAVWIFVICALGFWVCAAVQRRSWLPASPLCFSALALVMFYIISTVFSFEPRLSLIGRFGRYGGLLPLIAYVATMLIVMTVFSKQPARVKGLLWAAVSASAVVGTYVLIQAAGLDWQIWANDDGVPSEFPIGTLGNSNFAGSYLAISLPLLVYIILAAGSSAQRAVLGVLFAIHVVALWHTQTRGGLLAALAGLLCIALFKRSHFRPWIVGGSIAAVVVITVCALGLGMMKSALDSVSASPALASTSTLENRAHYWKAAFQIFLDHPVIGTGPDTFYAFYPQYRPAADALKNPFVLVDKPHNIFVERATDTGFVGISIYLLIIVLACGYGLRALRNANDGQHLLLLCVLGSFCAYLVQGFFSIDVPSTAFMGWVLLGVIACLADPAVTQKGVCDEKIPLERLERTRPRWSVHGGVAAISAILLILASRPLQADVRARAGDLEAAMRLQPLEAEYPARAGDLERSVAAATDEPTEKLAHLEKAQDYFLKARQLESGNFNRTLSLAGVNTVWAQTLDPLRFQVADRWWQRALLESPNDPGVEDRYREAVERMRDKAAELEGLASTGAQDPKMWLRAAEAYLAVENTTKARMAVEESLRIDPDDLKAKALRDALPA